MQEVRINDGRYPGTGLASPPEVFDIVTPDEELGANGTDSLNQFAGDQHPVERDDNVGDDAVALRLLQIIKGAQHVGGAWPADREAEFVGALLSQDRRAPEVESALVGQQLVEALRRRQSVIVHQPGKLGSEIVRPLKTSLETPGTAGIRLKGLEPHLAIS